MFLILIIFLINIDFNDSEQNILLGKSVSFCGSKTNNLTDGDRQEAQPLHKSATCIALKLQIQQDQILKKMMIFTGETGPGSRTLNHSMDSLIIMCGVVNQECAAISSQMRMIKHMEEGIRLNFFNEIPQLLELVFTNEVDNVNLAEIEAYGRDDVTHRGCFTNVSSDKNFTFDGFEACQIDCKQSPFGISEPLSSCFCLDEIDFKNEVSLSECNATCDDSDNKCGGNNTHSIYIQQYFIPAFAGCRMKSSFLVYVSSRGEAILEVFVRDLTFSKCVRFCGHSNSFFLNGKCSCATKIHFQKVQDSSSFCDIPCEFDNETACGGELGVSVYRNCATNKPIPCDKLLNCKRAIFDHHGVCTHGCKFGFEGEHCLLKVSDPKPGEIDEPDEVIEAIAPNSTGPIRIVTSPNTWDVPIDTQDFPTDSQDFPTGSHDFPTHAQEKSSMVPSPDTKKSITRLTSPDTKDFPIDVEVYGKSVRIMADYIISIWVAEAAMFFILF